MLTPQTWGFFPSQWETSPLRFWMQRNFSFFCGSTFSVLQCFFGASYSNHTVFFQCNRRGLERKHFEQVTKMRHDNLVSAFYLSGAILKEREIDEGIKGPLFRETKLLSWHHCKVLLQMLYIERLYTNVLHAFFDLKMRKINGVDPALLELIQHVCQKETIFFNKQSKKTKSS